jgi:hydrogenase expression/formation protein HypE
MTGISLANGPLCPAPLAHQDRVQLGHGSGGRMSAALMRDIFLPAFTNDFLAQLGDAAVLPVRAGRIAMSTDSFVVNPLEFPGGDIGTLAVHGTINDVAMMGATPAYITAGFILEEGLPLEVLSRVVGSMSAAARAAGIAIVSGDTKVVERGKADGLYINTTGIGMIDPDFTPGPHEARPGDCVLVSGPIGSHGIAIMAARGQLDFEAEVRSDTAALHGLVRALRDSVGGAVHVLRDPTRGGVASTLNEIASASNVGISLDEGQFEIPGPVAAACEMLGLDPLYVANEGVLIAIVAPELAERALEAMRELRVGRRSSMVGQVVRAHPGMVTLKTALGATRVVDMLPGDQLPRIC